MKQKLLNSFKLRAIMLVAILCAGFTSAWGDDVTDVITASDLTATGTTYTDFSSVSITSDAVYAGQSAKDASGNIQMRSKNSNSGIVSTTSGGTVKSVKITVGSGTNTVDVYGSNTAYEAVSDLYNANKQGTKIGSLTATGTITFSDDYKYVGIRSNSGAIYLSSIEIVWETSGSGSSAVATTTSIDASGITNTDVYTSTVAGSLAATVTAGGNAVAGATVTWSGNNDNVATINSSTGAVTLVAAGSVTFTATYAGVAGTYQSSTDTYEMTVTNSAPYVQPTTIEITPNYTFWGQTAQFSGSTYSELSGSQDNVTLEWSRGNGSTYANTSAMRFYKENTLTFTAPTGYEIQSIELSVSGTYSDLAFDSGSFDSENTTWTGASQAVTMSRPANASSYATISKFTITLAAESTDPSITASDVNIEYGATGGNITFTLKNEVTGGLISASTTADWLTLGNETSSPISFTCSANETTTERTATVTLTYTYNTSETVTKDVTITQAAAPVIYTTIPALFAAATDNSTPVNVTFGNWVVTGVNGNQVFVSDGTNGFIVYQRNHGFVVGNTLSGTVSCNLVLYNESTQITGLTSATTGLTVGTGGTVTPVATTIDALSAVNTGSVVTLSNLTYNGSVFSDGANTIELRTSLFDASLTSGKTYNIKGVFHYNNSTKCILPRSAEDIEEVVSTDPSITVAETSVNVSATDEEGTIGITYDNLTITDMTDFDIQFCDEQGDALDSSDEPDWIMVEVASQDPQIGEGYVISYIMNENTATEERSAYFKVFAMGDQDFVYSDLITITQAAPLTGDQYVLYTGDLVEGDYIICYDGKAMNTTVTSDRLQYAEVTPENDVITTDNAEIVWHIAKSGDYWTIYNAEADAYAASTGAKNKAQMLADGTDDKALWTVSATFDFVNKANTAAEVNAHLRNNGTYGFACYAEGTGGALSLYKKVAPATESVTVTAAGYATYCSENALDFTNSSIKAYVGTLEGTALTFTPISQVPANEGLLLVCEGGASENIPVIASASAVQNNCLVGVNTAATLTANDYILNVVNGAAGFYKAGEFTSLAAHRAYIPAQVGGQVKSFAINFDDTDAIGAIKAVNDKAEIFNLAGQRVNKAQKGIYIVNGKKVLVK